MTSYARSVFREKIRRLGSIAPTMFNDLTVSGSDGRLWAITSMNTETGVLGRVWVDTYSNGRMTYQIDASSARGNGRRMAGYFTAG